MAPLRLNATISNGRITISFSHNASATIYDKYLQRLEDSFYENQNCKLAELGHEISLDLPTGITGEPVDRPKDVELSFTVAEEALAWEQKMILWAGMPPESSKLRLSRGLTVEQFADELAGKGIDEAHLMAANSVITSNCVTNKGIGGSVYFRES